MAVVLHLLDMNANSHENAEGWSGQLAVLNRSERKARKSKQWHSRIRFNGFGIRQHFFNLPMEAAHCVYYFLRICVG